MAKPLSDEYPLYQCLADSFAAMEAMAPEDQKTVALELLQAYQGDLLKAAEADLLLDFLLDTDAHEQLGVPLVNVPARAREAARAMDAEPFSRAEMWAVVKTAVEERDAA